MSIRSKWRLSGASSIFSKSTSGVNSACSIDSKGGLQPDQNSILGDESQSTTKRRRTLRRISSLFRRSSIELSSMEDPPEVFCNYSSDSSAEISGSFSTDSEQNTDSLKLVHTAFSSRAPENTAAATLDDISTGSESVDNIEGLVKQLQESYGKHDPFSESALEAKSHYPFYDISRKLRHEKYPELVQRRRSKPTERTSNTHLVGVDPDTYNSDLYREFLRRLPELRQLSRDIQDRRRAIYLRSSQSSI